MASWDDLMSFVRVRYEIMRQVEGELWFNLPTPGDRTQIVLVKLVTGEDGRLALETAMLISAQPNMPSHADGT